MRKTVSTNNPFIWYLAVIAILFLSLDSSGNAGDIRNPLSTLLQPISFSGINTSKKILAVTEGISKVEKTSLIIESLNERITQLESKVSDYDILQEKYDSLLLHAKTASKKYEYIQAGVHISKSNGDLILDIGRDENVAINDVVVLGNVYIGKIISVDSRSSLVRTADDFGSNIEVVIQKTKKSNSESNPIRAVAVGNKNEIIIENIANNSSVTNGDIVYIDDKEIGSFLVIGKITSIMQDKAASVLTAKVISDVDLLLTKFVYVRK